jgi:hypothetical protein
MSLRQIQVANDSVQDRLVLRIGTTANEEIRVFFTRRFLREIWPHMTALLAGHLAAKPVTSPDENSEPAHFDQAFQDSNPTYPLGANPLLASEASFEITGEGSARLTLREGRERSFNINLNAELLQALCAMLRAASEQNGWDLALDYSQPVAAHSANPGKSFLH